MKLARSIRDKLTEILPANSLRRRFAKGAFWSIAGAIVSQGLALAASIVTARILGKVGFGELGMIVSTVGMFGLFAGLGLGLTATKHIAQYRSTDPLRAGRIIAMCSAVAMLSAGLISAVIFFTAPYLAAYTINAPQLTTELRIGCGLLFFNAIVGAQTGVLAGFEAFKTIAKVNLLRGLANFPLMVCGVYLFGLPGAVGARVAAAALAWIINQIALKKESRKANVLISYKGISSELQILWAFSVPAFLSQAMVGPVMWAANVILANQPKGYSEIAVFSAAWQWWRICLFFPQSFAHITLPILADRFGENDRKRIRKALGMSILCNGAVSLPLAIILSLFSYYIMSLYGSSFADAGIVLIIVAWASLLVSVQMPVGQLIAASGNMWIGFLTNVAWAAVFLGSFVALRNMGALGLTISILISYAAHASWTFVIAYWITTKKMRLR